MCIYRSCLRRDSNPLTMMRKTWGIPNSRLQSNIYPDSGQKSTKIIPFGLTHNYVTQGSKESNASWTEYNVYNSVYKDHFLHEVIKTQCYMTGGR